MRGRLRNSANRLIDCPKCPGLMHPVKGNSEPRALYRILVRRVEQAAQQLAQGVAEGRHGPDSVCLAQSCNAINCSLRPLQAV